MFIADLHIHSKYSRATSRDCDTAHLDFWARRKGIHLLGTGDFTHPAWREELKEKLDRLTALNALLNMDENGEQVEQKQESQDRSKAVHSSIREKLNSLKEKTAVSSGMERQLVRPLSVKKDECLQM